MYNKIINSWEIVLAPRARYSRKGKRTKTGCTSAARPQSRILFPIFLLFCLHPLHILFRKNRFLLSISESGFATCAHSHSDNKSVKLSYIMDNLHVGRWHMHYVLLHRYWEMRPVIFDKLWRIRSNQYMGTRGQIPPCNLIKSLSFFFLTFEMIMNP